MIMTESFIYVRLLSNDILLASETLYMFLQPCIQLYFKARLYFIQIDIRKSFLSVLKFIHDCICLITCLQFRFIDMSAKLKKTIKEKIQDIKDQRDVIVAFLNEFVSEVKFYL